MPQRLRIERSLERGERSTGQPLYTKYLNLKHELFKQANYWAGRSRAGTTTGPGTSSGSSRSSTSSSVATPPSSSPSGRTSCS